MLVSGTEYLELDQVERDFCSGRQTSTHTQQKEVIDERELHPDSQKVSWV